MAEENCDKNSLKSTTDIKKSDEIDEIKTDSNCLQPSSNLLSNEKQQKVETEDIQLNYNLWDIFCVFITLFVCVLDQVTDLLVAIYFYQHESFMYFTLTLAFLLLPSIAVSIASFSWHIQDYRNGIRLGNRFIWIVRVISLFLGCNLITRCLELLYRGCKVLKKKPKSDEVYLIICDETDVSLLRFIEVFMESAPQMVIQMTILIINDVEETDEFPLNPNLQVISIISSAVSFAWSIASYNRCLHLTVSDKLKMLVGTLCLFMWRFCDISARTLSIATFSSLFPMFIPPVIVVHWIMMSIWIMLQKTDFCKTRKREVFFDMVLGVIYIFCFVNVTEGRTIYKVSAFYIVMLFEGAGLIMTWFMLMEPMEWYQMPALVSFFSLFVFGMILMRVYYIFFHPTASLRGRLPKTENCNSIIFNQPKKLRRRARSYLLNA